MDKNLNNGLTKISLGIWLSIMTVMLIIIGAANDPALFAIANSSSLLVTFSVIIITAYIYAMIITSGIHSVVKHLKK